MTDPSDEFEHGLDDYDRIDPDELEDGDAADLPDVGVEDAEE